MPYLVPSAPRIGRPVLRARRGSTTLVAPAAPDTPSTPSPASTATAYYSLLSWVSARQAHADVYFGTNPSPPLLVSAYVGTSWIPPALAGSTTYYWKIVASNDGGSATGPIWSFSTLSATSAIVALAGSVMSARVREGSLSIHDALNAAPNTGSLTITTTAPTSGQAITIGLGTLDAANLLFGGEIQADDPTYVGIPSNGLWPVTLIDYTFALNKRRPFGTWVNVSASIIARYCVAVFAPGFTGNHIQDNLPAVSITFDGSEDFLSCFSRLATAITTTAAQPGQTKVDYSKDVWLFLVDATDPPDPIDLTHPPLGDAQLLRFTTDLSQVRTRVYGKGHGETVPCPVGGGETIVPIANAVMFNAMGGRAIAAITADGAQSQLLTYAGLQLGGAGTLVGPAVAPTTAPTVSRLGGTGIESGSHDYAVVWVVGAGRTLPSPVNTVVFGPLSTPIQAPTITFTPNAFLSTVPGGTTLDYALALADPSGSATSNLGPIGTLIASGAAGYRTVSFTVTADMVGSQVLVTRRDNGGSWYATSTSFFYSSDVGSVVSFNETAVTAVDFGGGGGVVFVPNPNANQASLTFSLGPTGTTARELYRTALGSSQLKLLTTIANNTSTGPYVDSTADAALGANAPSSDTSGLTQAVGQVNAGSPTLLTAGASTFPPNGGWVVLGQQIVRFTGISGNTLTGIPATGPGALTATVPYGSAVTTVPALIGVNHNNGVALALALGAKINLWVQRDDLAAQTALGLLELDTAGLPTDGIREHLIVDERRTEASLAAACDADLAQFARPTVTVTYQTRDPKTKSGKSVYVNTVVGPVGAYVIQDVTITFDGPALYPRYAVSASSVRFTLEDLLRRVVIT